MKAEQIKRALRNQNTSADRIGFLYDEYNRLIDSFEFYDEGEELLLMFDSHPNCPEEIKGQIQEYLETINSTDDSGEDDDFLRRQEDENCDPNIGLNIDLGDDEENIHFEPTRGWIKDE